MTKRLSIDQNFFEDIKLLGLVTHLKDYRLAYFMNQEMGLKLARYADFEMTGKESQHAWYYFSKGRKYHSFTLINNTDQNGKLISEPRVDFLLLIKNAIDENLVSEILTALRKINGIALALPLNMTKIKNAELLLEALELHELKEVIRPKKTK